jgi:DNA-binding MarR family transcriptional regulator
MNDSPIHKRLKQSHFESELQQAMLSLLVAADIIKRKQLAVCSTKELTHSQYNILRILKGCYPEGYCRKDIIERMLEKAPDVTRLIDGLVSEGNAERIPGSTDKRMSLTRITEKGLNLLKELHEPMQSFSQELDQIFSAKDLLYITELCGRIITADMESQSKGVQS